MIKKVKRTDFIKNVLTLTTGTTVAQAIPVLIAPILTRLYTPEDFGVLTLFISITTLLSVAVTGKYELAIVLPRRDKNAQKLVRLSLLLTTLSCCLFFILILLAHGTLLSWFKDKRIGFWLYFIPLSVLLSSAFEVFRYYSIRHKAYRSISESSVMRAGSASLFQVFAGLAGTHVTGLILGQIVSLFSGNIRVAKVFNRERRESQSFPFFKTKDLKSVAFRYVNFPKFTLPSLVLNTASLQMPIYVFATFFSSAVVGFYALSQRVLNVPMNVIGASIGQVYFQKAAEYKGNAEQLRTLTWKLYKQLLWLGIFPIAIILIWGKGLFGFVFGPEWAIAGAYAQLLSIWILFVFISSPLSNLFFVQEKQKHGLILQIIIFVSRGAVLLACVLLHYDAMRTVLLFGIIGAILFFLFIFYLLSSVGIRKLSILAYTFMVIAAGIIPLYLIDKVFS